MSYSITLYMRECMLIVKNISCRRNHFVISITFLRQRKSRFEMKENKNVIFVVHKTFYICTFLVLYFFNVENTLKRSKVCYKLFGFFEIYRNVKQMFKRNAILNESLHEFECSLCDFDCEVILQISFF